MKFNLKVIAAAVALAASAAASAQVASSLDRMSTENSSLVFLGLNTTGPGSVLINLDFNFDTAKLATAFAAPGTSIVWNFRTNSMTFNGVARPGNFSWSTAFGSFDAITGGTDRWAVIAGDSGPDLDGLEYLTTGMPTTTQINALTLGRASTMANVDNLYAANESRGTHVTTGVTAGANFETAGAPYVGGTWFGTAGQWTGTALPWTAFANAGASTNFRYINVQPRIGAPGLAQVTQFGVLGAGTAGHSTFHYDDGVLTWTSPVPEASTYAMLLAGLAVVGFIARRRQRV